MQQTQPPPSAANILTRPDVEMDTFLPGWARRSNPVVKRALGPFWKRLPPDATLIAKIVAGECLLLVLPVQFLLTLTLPLAMLAVVLIPVLAFLYGRVLLGVVNNAAAAIVTDAQHHTLDLLRITLLPPEHIILGKIAASVWERVEDIDMVLIGGVLFSLPFLLIRYTGGAAPGDVTLWMRAITLLAIVALPLRVVLEPFMFAALAVALGIVLPTRATVVVTVLGGMVFYYLLLFVPLAAPMAPLLRLSWEVMLPVALPASLIVSAVRFSLWAIQR